MSGAINAQGERTTLPPRPSREDFDDTEEWEEALAGWNHFVRPLLNSRRGADAKKRVTSNASACGAGAEGDPGFQRGNTCAAEDGKGSDSKIDPDSSGVFKGNKANPQGKDTFEQYTYEDGTWTEERQKLHDEIVADILGKATPVEDSAAYLMGGGAASGKSSAIHSGDVQIPENHVIIDPDAIKGYLPEYKDMLERGDTKAASFAHEESSYLSKRVLKEASEQGYNTLLDGTGDSGYESLAKKVQTMRADGRKVIANYVTVDVEVAMQRNRARAAKTGRLVPESALREAHAQVSRVVPLAIERRLFDEFKLFDTNGDKVRKVAELKNGEFVVHEPELWRRFLKKGE